MQSPAKASHPTSSLAVVLALFGLALALRIGVVVAAGAFGSSDSVGDLPYHSQLIDDPVGHLRHSDAGVTQYAPYLGILEAATARPWLALGADHLTALRLGSVTWDLIGMALLLVAVSRYRPERIVVAGLVWAVVPLLWPASAYSAQDEPISAAIVALAVVLSITRRRAAAVAVAVIGLFVAKVLLFPLLIALLLTAPPQSRRRMWGTAAVTFGVMVAITWVLSGTDGLSQQLRYTSDVLGFSVSAWSTFVLHHVVQPKIAIRLSVVLACAGVLALIVVWSKHNEDGEIGASRLAAALFFVCFAVLAISNPEYLCLAAPVAIIASLSVKSPLIPWQLIVVATLAWTINAVYYLLRKAYDPTGSVLGVTGFVGNVGARVRFFDVIHQFLLAGLCFALLGTAWHWVRETGSESSLDGPRTDDRADGSTPAPSA